MNRNFLIFLFSLSFSLSLFGQSDSLRLEKIRNQIEELSKDNPGFNEAYKTDILVSDITLSNFLIALSEVHGININVGNGLNQQIRNNFTNVKVGDLLVFLCKVYQLDIDFTGNILSVKKFVEPVKKTPEKVIPINYNPSNNKITLDIKEDKLYDVFKKITDRTGKNLVFSPGLENEIITGYIKESPFDIAMEQLAFTNGLYFEKTEDGFYLFEKNVVKSSENNPNYKNQPVRPRRKNKSNFYYKVIDFENKLIEVDFTNTPIADIVDIIGSDLKIDVFTATPLSEAGSTNFKSKNITFDELLTTVFASQKSFSNKANNLKGQQYSSDKKNNNVAETYFTFKKEGNLYYFGTSKQLSVRSIEIISLQHRSVELLVDPSGGYKNRNNYSNTVLNSNFQTDNFTSNNRQQGFSNQNNRNQNNFRSSENESNLSLKDLLPGDLLDNIDITIDTELNSFYVNGATSDIQRFKSFMAKIDKPVPVVLIEVMLIEVLRSNTVDTGIDWGIGNEPTTTTGSLFPEANVNLGAKTINKIIGGFNGFGSLNIGKVVPNFFANIKALETNGDLKVRSAPKLSTLNGHKAYFSNSQTSYYAVTQRNIYGTDNPQTSEITNYQPIDAELGLTIKPFVAADGSITLDISVIQSNFGDRIEDNAPPNISAREFTSIIRMNNQDIAVLGGLEEQRKENSGSGVPFLARIPVIKWFFSKRIRTASKAKLTVLIKPTVIY